MHILSFPYFLLLKKNLFWQVWNWKIHFFFFNEKTRQKYCSMQGHKHCVIPQPQWLPTALRIKPKILQSATIPPQFSQPSRLLPTRRLLCSVPRSVSSLPLPSSPDRRIRPVSTWLTLARECVSPQLGVSLHPQIGRPVKNWTLSCCLTEPGGLSCPMMAISSPILWTQVSFGPLGLAKHPSVMKKVKRASEVQGVCFLSPLKHIPRHSQDLRWGESMTVPRAPVGA